MVTDYVWEDKRMRSYNNLQKNKQMEMNSKYIAVNCKLGFLFVCFQVFECANLYFQLLRQILHEDQFYIRFIDFYKSLMLL